MAHSVKCLPGKHKDQGSIPDTHPKSQVWWLILVTPTRVRGDSSRSKRDPVLQEK